jgi:hypothetical protein
MSDYGGGDDDMQDYGAGELVTLVALKAQSLVQDTDQIGCAADMTRAIS